MIAKRRRPLRLPDTLTFTALSCAVMTTLACSGQTDGKNASDAGTPDAVPVAHDSAADCDGTGMYCGGGPCPNSGAYYCGPQCPTGCEPFV